jgi:hypothetical protein
MEDDGMQWRRWRTGTWSVYSSLLTDTTECKHILQVAAGAGLEDFSRDGEILSKFWASEGLIVGAWIEPCIATIAL